MEWLSKEPTFKEVNTFSKIFLRYSPYKIRLPISPFKKWRERDILVAWFLGRCVWGSFRRWFPVMRFFALYSNIFYIQLKIINFENGFLETRHMISHVFTVNWHQDRPGCLTVYRMFCKYIKWSNERTNSGGKQCPSIYFQQNWQSVWTTC